MKKKGLLILGLVGLLALASVPITMTALLYALPDVYQHTFYGAMKGKIDHLNKAEGKKIVVIGGSSVPFSLDSNLIKKELPAYEPVDFGLYASLGTNLMLDLASNHIGKDDIVIITPEISKQTLSLYYDGLETHKALERNKDLFFKLERKMGEALIGAIPSFIGQKMSYISKGELPIPKDIYASASFNEYGDIGVYRKENIMLNGVDANNPISFDSNYLEDAFIERVNEFGNSCKNHGASVYFRFAPMNDAALSNRADIASFYDALHSKLSFPILGDPYASILEKEWFYDTNFHLNSSGVVNWSKRFIQDIKLTLDDTSITDIAEADMPPLVGPDEEKDGDNTNEGDFAYAMQGEETTITKMINEKTEMVVPYRHDEKIITSFGQGVFQGAKTLRQITIQDNIRLLHDQSFANSGLERIIIDNDSPNSIGVGDHLLDGCSADIYVRKENVSAYKMSYNWAKYASRIKEI